jgi:uncharacterized Zn finger protein (UPF0148 family)
MTNDDEGQYWAEMQAEAQAAEAEAAMAAEAEYQQEIERQLTAGQMSDIQCPKCGCRTLINRRGDVWCSFVGGTNEAACDYSTKMLPEEIQKLVSKHFWELLA